MGLHQSAGILITKKFVHNKIQILHSIWKQPIRHKGGRHLYKKIIMFIQKTSTHKSEQLGNVLNYVQSNRYVLPSFQRDYVWKMEQIEELFNSIRLGYPLGSLLLWNINTSYDNQNFQDESFYGFLGHYGEENSSLKYQKVQILDNNDYWVVLDGQQRLTSLNIGLFGTYSKRKRYQRKGNSDYPVYRLYMLISEDAENPFKFIKDPYTCAKIHVDAEGKRWLLVREIFFAKLSRDLVRLHHITEAEEDRVSEFMNNLKNLYIDFSELRGFDYNEATKIFVKVNSGGTVLQMADILNSIIVSTWKKRNAKEEFKELCNKIASQGFSINTNYIVKAILFLLHSDVRFQIQGFTEFISTVEDKWDAIKSSIIEMFDLLKSYKLNHNTLGGYNVTLPVLYYIYHKGIKNAATTPSFSDDRKSIKQWIHSAILLKIFGASSDSTLTKIKSVFIEKIAQNVYISETQNAENQLYTAMPNVNVSVSHIVLNPINRDITSFPADKIKEALVDDWYISEDSLEKLLTTTQKGDRYSLPILSLLYPDFELLAVDYEQDHLHPLNRYKEMPQAFQDDVENKKLYNSIVNLQLLPKAHNVQKSDIPMKEWIESVGNIDDLCRTQIIPNDVNLFEESEVVDFFDERKKMLVEKLQALLNS